eukprot:6213515-Amphidinium_carterae.1
MMRGKAVLMHGTSTQWTNTFEFAKCKAVCSGNTTVVEHSQSISDKLCAFQHKPSKVYRAPAP